MRGKRHGIKDTSGPANHHLCIRTQPPGQMECDANHASMIALPRPAQCYSTLGGQYGPRATMDHYWQC